jgi:hypothetical protein
VGLGRFELPTLGLGNQCSIHLSYSPWTKFTATCRNLYHRSQECMTLSVYKIYPRR